MLGKRLIKAQERYKENRKALLFLVIEQFKEVTGVIFENKSDEVLLSLKTLHWLF